MHCVLLFNSRSIELITYFEKDINKTTLLINTYKCCILLIQKKVFFISLYYDLDEKFCDPRLEKMCKRLKRLIQNIITLNIQ